MLPTDAATHRMPFDIQYRQEDRIIEVVYTGVVNPADLEQSVQTTIALADEKSTARFLVDGTSMRGA
jgi:hypothetical protein